MPTADLLPITQTLPHEPFCPAERLSRRDWTLALLVALLAGAFHLLLANQRGFWGDEALTALSTRLSLLDQCRERIAQGHSPLYFIYARLGHLFGETERAYRIPSALATVLTVLGLTGLAGALGLRRYRYTFWALVFLQPFWITLGTQARYMMLLLAESTFLLWAAVIYVREFKWRRGVPLALATSLLLWTHSSAQFFTMGLLVFLAWEARERWRSGAFPFFGALGRLWPVLLGILSSAPLLYLTRNNRGQAGPKHLALDSMRQDLLEVLYGDYQLWPRFLHWPSWPLLVVEITLVAATLALAARALRRRRQDVIRRLVTALAVFTPLGFYLFCNLVRNFGSPARYLSLFSLPMVIAMAVAWYAPARRPLLLAFRVLLVAFLGVQSAATALERGDHHREACRWAVEHVTPNESLVLVSGPANLLGVQMNGLKGNIDIIMRDSSRPETSSFPRMLQTALRHHSRVIFINYFNPHSIVKDIESMMADKVILDVRHWRIGRKIVVGAFIRDKSDRAWLEHLPKPQKAWGPARYD